MTERNRPARSGPKPWGPQQKARHRAAGVTELPVAEKIEVAEDILLEEAGDARRTVARLRDVMGISTSYGRKLVLAVRRRWEIEEAALGRQPRKNELRAMARNGASLALKATKLVFPHGPALPGEWVKSPDLDKLHRFLKLLCELDGLLDIEAESQEKVQIVINQMNNVAQLSDHDLLTQLSEQLRDMELGAPDQSTES